MFQKYKSIMGTLVRDFFQNFSMSDGSKCELSNNIYF